MRLRGADRRGESSNALYGRNCYNMIKKKKYNLSIHRGFTAFDDNVFNIIYDSLDLPLAPNSETKP